MRRTGATPAVVGGLVSALLLVSCGGDVSGELPQGEASRSLSASVSVTASLPSPTRTSILTDPPATDGGTLRLGAGTDAAGRVAVAVSEALGAARALEPARSVRVAGTAAERS